MKIISQFINSEYRETLRYIRMNYASNHCFIVYISLIITYIFFISILFATLGKPYFTAPLFILIIVWGTIRFYRFCDSNQLLKRDFVAAKTLPWVKISFVIFIFFCCFLVYAKVQVSVDTVVQWQQILSGYYSDWHPVMHTFSIWLFYKLTHWYVGVVLCFGLCFSMICGWLYSSLRKYGYKKEIVVSLLLLIILSPVTMFQLRILWKDTAFGIAVLFLSTAFLNIWESQGNWLLKKLNLFLLGLILIYTTFVRHNGLFFTVPFLVLFPIIKLEHFAIKYRIVFSVIICCGIMGYIQGREIAFSYGYLSNVCFLNADEIRQASENQNRPKRPTNEQEKCLNFSEAVGLPMSIMSEVLIKTPEKMPSQAKEFMYQIAPSIVWEENYKGDFNSVKFVTWPRSKQIIDATAPKDFFAIFWETCKASPSSAFGGFRHVTSLGLDPLWNNISFFNGNDISFYQNPLCRMCGFLLFAPGFWLLFLIVAVGYAIAKIGYSAFFIALPYIAYTLGTTLLLTGCDHRFFYAMLIGIPPIVLLLLSCDKQKKKVGD